MAPYYHGNATGLAARNHAHIAQICGVIEALWRFDATTTTLKATDR